jgi:hypothetical protein
VPNVFDDSRFPLVVIEAVGSSSDEDVRERLAFLEKVLARGSTGVLVFDSSGNAGLSAMQRRMWVDWLAKHDVALRERSLAAAFVTPNALVRGTYTAVFWLWSPPFTHVFVRTREEAMAWAENRLRDQGAALPGAARS